MGQIPAVRARWRGRQGQGQSGAVPPYGLALLMALSSSACAFRRHCAPRYRSMSYSLRRSRRLYSSPMSCCGSRSTFSRSRSAASRTRAAPAISARDVPEDIQIRGGGLVCQPPVRWRYMVRAGMRFRRSTCPGSLWEWTDEAFPPFSVDRHASSWRHRDLRGANDHGALVDPVRG